MLKNRTSLSIVAGLLVVAGGMAACSDSETSNAANTTATSNGGNNTGGGGSGASGGNTGGSGGTGGATGGGGAGGVADLTDANCDAPSGTAGNLTAVEVAGGFSRPLAVAYAWGDSERLYVVEQPGRIQLVKGNTSTLFLDIQSKVQDGGNEQGLLGLAFHPDYINNGRFFVHYSNAPGGPGMGNGATVIEEYRRDMNNPDLADPDAVQLIYTTGQFAGNHNGGTIAFSPVDGYLWIALGDGGGGGDPQDNGQDKTTPLATLLRLDIDSAQPYATPDGNITDGLAEIHDWGLRNPFRMSFDICTGDRYIGDVGQDCYEEINAAPASQGPTNWGWNVMEADHCYPGCGNLPSGNMCGREDVASMARPIVELQHSGGMGDSITGGHVYRGSLVPWLRGAYIYGEFAQSDFYMLRWDGSSVTEGPTNITNQIAVGSPSGFGVDNDGELYFTSFNGNLYRIEAE